MLVSHPVQGWSLLCNGVVLFDDTGELLPDGSTVAPHRPAGSVRCRPARRDVAELIARMAAAQAAGGALNLCRAAGLRRGERRDHLAW